MRAAIALRAGAASFHSAFFGVLATARRTILAACGVFSAAASAFVASAHACFGTLAAAAAGHFAFGLFAVAARHVFAVVTCLCAAWTCCGTDSGRVFIGSGWGNGLGPRGSGQGQHQSECFDFHKFSRIR